MSTNIYRGLIYARLDKCWGDANFFLKTQSFLELMILYRRKTTLWSPYMANPYLILLEWMSKGRKECCWITPPTLEKSSTEVLASIEWSVESGVMELKHLRIFFWIPPNGKGHIGANGQIIWLENHMESILPWNFTWNLYSTPLYIIYFHINSIFLLNPRVKWRL